jgi:hypothetical protein
MEHKAYAFEWSAFDVNLHPLLVVALTTNDTTGLLAFIGQHFAQLKDPYDGDLLSVDWRENLGNRDVQEYGDYALTLFYDPAECSGIGCDWAGLSDELPQHAADAMLGFPVGPTENLFDPGRYGSYFQTPGQVQVSLKALQPNSCPQLARFMELLERCVIKQQGVYVTF